MRRSRKGMEQAIKNLLSQLQTIHPDLNPSPSIAETQSQESLRIESFHLPYKRLMMAYLVTH